MALNVTAIIDQIKARIAAADSSTNPIDLVRLVQAAQNFDNYSTSSIMFAGDLPTEDSSIAGDIIFVRDKRFDNKGTFYFGRDSATWDRVLTSSEVLEDSDYLNNTGVLVGAPGFSVQASDYGYSVGGYGPGVPATTAIQKFSLTSDGNATTVGNTPNRHFESHGFSSLTTGYATRQAQPAPLGLYMDKFPFADETAAVQLGSGFGFGGGWTYSTTSTGYYWGPHLYSFPFAVEDTYTQIASGVFNTTRTSLTGAGAQDGETMGYYGGGQNTALPVAILSAIDKFPFASGATAVGHGNLATATAYDPLGHSSATAGYISSGNNPPNNALTLIQKFPFAANTTASNIGSLTIAQRFNTRPDTSSTDYGYSAGGITPLQPISSSGNTIQKFSFVTDGNATDVGDLAIPARGQAGCQV